MNDPSNIGFIGAGRMGGPMVRRLVAAGHRVHALGRTGDKRRALAESGAYPLPSIAETGVGADVVIVCVLTDEQVRRVCLGTYLIPAMSPGATLVVHTTGSPRTVEAVAEHAAARGVEVVDAAVSGGPHDIADGRLTLFVGGADAAVDRVSPVLASYADPILPVGPLGNGQRVKLLNNAAFAAQIGVLAETMRLANQLGIEESTLLRALPHGSATSRALTGAAARGSVTEFVTAVDDFLTKDVAVVREVLAELDADLGNLTPLLADRPR
ncbi:NAD(P)-dependent oxidoreductase [Nocardia canadensis]|uniref:NAD(P)-dependent oxidoreductase n=1 Tax=Nocardia canadensis TaxID=3065238 RepID=UPI00292E241E|nr:NAD(P)-dependent oxidoreductase [Nocardia canadensis]